MIQNSNNNLMGKTKGEFPSRRNFLKTGVLAGGGLLVNNYVFATDRTGNTATGDPTQCAYAPPGEYIKDHSFLFHDNWWHFFSISGTQGYFHGYNDNWYRSGVFGKRDYWKLGFTQIQWAEDAAFYVVKPSILSE